MIEEAESRHWQDFCCTL